MELDKETLNKVYIWLMSDYVKMQKKLVNEKGILEDKDSKTKLCTIYDLILRYKDFYNIEDASL